MTKPTAPIDFTAKVTSLTIGRNAAGTQVTTINVEGSSPAFGPFVGTVTATGARQGGSWHYEAFALPPGGGNVTGVADGHYAAKGDAAWRTLGAGKVVTDDEGPIELRLDAEFDLAQRTWNGRLIPV